MIKKTVYFLFLILLALQSFASTRDNKNESAFLKVKEDAPKVFIDCHYCDMDHIRKNITFVNYVIEAKKADVYILITRLRTGSGGRKYTLEFKGQNRFKETDDKLIVITNQGDTEDKIRDKILKSLKFGLFQYVKKTKMSEYLDIMFKGITETKQIKDKWNNWVFDVGLSFSKSGEKSYRRESFDYSFSGKRVTESSIIEFKFSDFKRTSSYDIDGSILKSEIKSKELEGLFVKSISEHIAAGGKVKVDSSSFRNRKRRIKFYPAIEYNIFPYSEATSRMLRFNYGIGLEDTIYYETTIYNKDKERLFFHTLEGDFRIMQRWGDARIGIDFFQYLHDTKKYSMEVSGNLSWRIFKGLSFFTYYSYSVIHDQIYLPKGDLTQEEILLRTSALETNYEYRVSMGITFTFGSIYNNAVNPRFGYGNRGHRHR